MFVYLFVAAGRQEAIKCPWYREGWYQIIWNIT